MSPSPLRHPARLAGASLLRLQSDERLAQLAAHGHEAAFTAIVDRYRTPLTRYCAGIVGPNRAEDAVQQALINAHDALQRTDEVRHLRSWLYRIAHNAALNVLRTVRDDVSLDTASDATVATEDGPAATFERSERFRATLAALQELPERQRAALVLRELEGRSHEEIAETLGVTKGSARQHLMRARVAVRTAVTAITPYPVIVRLAELIASPGTAGWTDAAVGAGAGATLAKLTAGVAATGALVGGAVGTERVVHHRQSGQEAAQRSSGEPAKPRAVKARAVSLPAAGAVGSTGSAPSSSGRGAAGAGGDDRKGKDRDDHRGRGRDDSSGRDAGRHRRDDDDRDASHSRGRGGRSGADDSRGHGSGGSDDHRGRGRGGSDDSDKRRRSDDNDRSSGSGSSGRGSGSSGSGSRSGSSGSGSSSGPSGSGSSGSGSSGSRSGSDSSGSGSSGSSSDSSGSDSGSSNSGGDDSGSSGSGRNRGGSDDDSGSGSSRDSSSATATATPNTAPSTDSGSGSGRSGHDDDSD